MSTPTIAPPILVADPEGLRALAGALADCGTVAVDTESNSLHAYRERVCLLQFSTPAADFILDPIRLPNLTALAPFFASPSQQKVFHAAEYDILCLRRDFGFEFANLFDTMSAARTLGWPQVGLAAVLETHFGVTLSKKYQRSDWGRRPLSPEQLDYARLDTHYLLSLRDRQFQLLTESGRWLEATEEFARLARLRADDEAAGPEAPPAFWRVKGARDLLPAQAAVLQALFTYRDRQAERIDQPPFRVMNDALLLELARQSPTESAGLARLMTPAQVQRHGPGVLDAIRDGLAAPPLRVPALAREPDDVRDRYDRLHDWRKNRARARGVESDVIVPRSALWALARHPPRTEADLSRVDDIGPWRREAYGREILALLSGGLQPSVSTTDEVSATAGRTRPTDGSVAGESGT